MRVYKLLSVLIVLLSTITLKAQNDDVYYDPSYDRQSSPSTTTSRSNKTPQYADNTDRNADSYDNGQYDSQYYEYGDDYDDYQYSSRISRFQRPYRGFGYYDNAYVDNFYYDPFYYNRWFTPVISVSFGNPYWNHWNRVNRWNNNAWFDPFWNNYAYSGFGNGWNSCSNFGWGNNFYGNNYGGGGWGNGWNNGWIKMINNRKNGVGR